MNANAKRKLRKMTRAFFEAVGYLVIYKCRPCWPFQLYPLDKYGHTLDSIVGKMSVHKVKGHFGHVRKLLELSFR